jgi:hypothetical protein
MQLIKNEPIIYPVRKAPLAPVDIKYLNGVKKHEVKAF